jgi:hypothetical protein
MSTRYITQSFFGTQPNADRISSRSQEVTKYSIHNLWLNFDLKY